MDYGQFLYLCADYNTQTQIESNQFFIKLPIFTFAIVSYH